MSRTPAAREYVVDGKFSEECVELKVRSREEDILRGMGVRHLEGRATRPRYTRDESAAAILRQAGVRHVDAAERAGGGARGEREREGRGASDTLTLTRRELEVLRSAGVTWPDDMAVVYDDDTYGHRLGCASSAIGAGAPGGPTVNSTYAERELERRLAQGWLSAGRACEECGMQIISKSKGGMLECVICGVVGEDDDAFDEDEYVSDVEDSGGGTVEYVDACVQDEYTAIESPGILYVGTASTIAQSVAPSVLDPDRALPRGRELETVPAGDVPPEEGHREQCDARAEERVARSYGNEEEAYKEELGQRLFEGWELTKLNCPGCDLPLITEGWVDSVVCLRCG